MSDYDLTSRFRELADALGPDPALTDRVLARLAEDVPADAPVVEAVSGAGVETVPHSAPATRPNPSTATPTVRHDPGRPGDQRPTRRSRAHPGRLVGILTGGATSLVLAAFMLGGGVGLGHPTTVVTAWPPANAPATNAGVNAPGAATGTPTGTEVPVAPVNPVDPSSYSALFAAITAVATSPNYSTGGVSYAGPAMATGVSAPVAQDMSGTSNGTNVQVAGIDEGDFVKSSAGYLYVAHSRQVAVVAQAGAQSRTVATISVSGIGGSDDLVIGPVADMLIDGTTLIVLAHGFAPDLSTWSGQGGAWLSVSATDLKAAFYDIADPAHPRLEKVLSQSGTYVDSRLTDGTLYLVSQYTVNADGTRADDPGTFVPLVDDGTGPRPMVPGDIGMMPVVGTSTYSVVTAMAVGTPALLGQQAVLGNTSTVYMSTDNLYLAATQWAAPVGLPSATASPGPGPRIPGEPGSYDGSMTALVRIGLHAGKLAVEAQTTVAGSVISQFALDETAGYLRIATTWQSSSSWQQAAALWVLDPALTLVGSIPHLADNEGIQAVRFDGPVGYVVTYRQVDPLFALDLSDPTNPTVMSALKIPGFSEYLQAFGDGKLVGIGQDTRVDANKNVSTLGLKVSLFSVADPYNVSETATVAVDADVTEVAQDHKAGLVDSDKGLVGFPTQTWRYPNNYDGTQSPTVAWDYRLFTWTGAAFVPTVTIDLLGASPGTGWAVLNDPRTRAVLEGDTLYLATPAVVLAYDLTSNTALARVVVAP